MKKRAPIFFISGIVQGSLKGDRIHDQKYREKIKALIRARYPHCHIIDPIELNPGSLYYGDRKARKTFFEILSSASRADVVISYLPKASMGSALEMYQARRRGRVVVAISPLEKNWVVRYLSNHICHGIRDFASFLAGGGLDRFIKGRQKWRVPDPNMRKSGR